MWGPESARRTTCARLARRRRAKLVFDPLVSLFDTFSGDRGLVGLRSPVGRALWVLDEVTFRLPDLVLADTESQARYYRKALGVPPPRYSVRNDMPP